MNQDEEFIDSRTDGSRHAQAQIERLMFKRRIYEEREAILKSKLKQDQLTNIKRAL